MICKKCGMVYDDNCPQCPVCGEQGNEKARQFGMGYYQQTPQEATKAEPSPRAGGQADDSRPDEHLAAAPQVDEACASAPKVEETVAAAPQVDEACASAPKVEEAMAAAQPVDEPSPAASMSGEAVLPAQGQKTPASKKTLIIGIAAAVVVVALIGIFVLGPKAAKNKFHQDFQGTWTMEMGDSSNSYGGKLVITEDEMQVLFYSGSSFEIPVATLTYEVPAKGQIHLTTGNQNEYEVYMPGTDMMRFTPTLLDEDSSAFWFRQE